MNNPASANPEPEWRRRLSAQEALLNFTVASRQMVDTADLLQAASQLAIDITGAAGGFLYLRRWTDADHNSVFPAPVYRLEEQILHPVADVDPSAVQPLGLEIIEQVARQRQIYLADRQQHLLVSMHRHGKVLAVLDLYCLQRRFDDLDRALMAELVVQLDAILQSQRLFAARTALVSIAQSLSAELELTTLLEKVASSAAEIANAQAGSILLIQPDGKTMRFAAMYGVTKKDRDLLRQQVVPLRGSVAGSVALTGKPAISNDVAADPRFYASVSDQVDLKTRSLIAVPMVARDKAIGALEVINQKYGDGFDEADLDVISLFATQAAIAIENARLLAERQKNLAEVLKLEQRKSQFIALVSHELRTPLNIVTGYATLLRMVLDDLVLAPEHEAIEYLEHIDQGANRLVGLVNNITSMYNLETGRTQLLLEDYSVARLVQRVINEYTDWCHNKGLYISFEPASEDLTVVCDPIEVNRILGNLVNNAVKFTPEGGEVTIRARYLLARPSEAPTEDISREVVIAVSDTGPGIDMVHLETVFERFAQLGNHLNRVEGGIGLGLPLAKALVERHGGRLWVENNPDVGATFYFTLPAAEM